MAKDYQRIGTESTGSGLYDEKWGKEDRMWQVNVEVPASTSRFFVKGDLPHEEEYLKHLWFARLGIFLAGMGPHRGGDRFTGPG